MAKFYAVAKGRSNEPKILNSWDDCKKEVIGCKGAIYKSFQTKEEATNFINAHLGNNDFFKKNSNEICVEKITGDDIKGLKVYVDGSFKVSKGNYSYGLVVVRDDEVLYTDCGIGEDNEAIALRNVSGEVMGAMSAVHYAVENGHSEITIFFDYQGIESWAIGTWKRNNRITKEYNEFMQDKMKSLKINFKKVKGHSGDKYNDLADSLAKKALDKIV